MVSMNGTTATFDVPRPSESLRSGDIGNVQVMRVETLIVLLARSMRRNIYKIEVRTTIPKTTSPSLASIIIKLEMSFPNQRPPKPPVSPSQTSEHML